MAQEVKTKEQADNFMTEFAAQYNIEPRRLWDTLKATAFRQKEGTVITDAQMVALVLVAKAYNLNPFTKEIYAFPAKDGGIVPIVSVDGWRKIGYSNPDYAGHEIEYSEEMVTMPKSKPCPEWAKITIHKKSVSLPVIVTEHLDEVFRDLSYPNPWQTHPKRMLRHKVIIQGFREAFGFSGIHDDDEAERIVEAKDQSWLKTEVQQPTKKEEPIKKQTEIGQ